VIHRFASTSCLPPMCTHHPTICLYFFFFNDTATTEIYTLSLHDALPIWIWSPPTARCGSSPSCTMPVRCYSTSVSPEASTSLHRSEEHTSELQSRSDLVCRLLLEKKKKQKKDMLFS